MVEIKQYAWEKEERYPPHDTHGPHLGRRWAYFPLDWRDREKAHRDGKTTETITVFSVGRVDHIDWENGVITTDAGEILIRG